LRNTYLNEKRLKKGKKKRNSFSGGPGGVRPSQARGTRARASAQLRPTGRETARARESDGVIAGLTRQRERRGKRRRGSTARANRPSVGKEKPAAGGLGGDSPPVGRFLVHGEVP
jgi:hypothetical protein